MVLKLPFRKKFSILLFMVRCIGLIIIQSLLITILKAHPGIAQNALNTRLTLRTGTATLRQVFNTVEEKTGLRFIYSNSEVNDNQTLSLKVRNRSTRDLLQLITNQTNVVFWLSSKHIVVTSAQNPEKPVDAVQITAPGESIAILQNLPGKDAGAIANGGITGTVTDKKTGEPLIGAAIQVKGTTRGVSADIEGKFSITALPAGKVTLVVTFIGYEAAEVNVTVADGQSANVIIQLNPSSTTLNEVKVEANRETNREVTVLKDRQNSAVAQDAISLQQIERAATVNMAQALQKVPGVSLKEGKYISVRGMSDRNIVVEMNGSRMSSSDAARSSVPMDLIPSQLLDNLVVEKTVTPDKPGDATAGLVSIKTRSIPDSLVLTGTVQAGFNGNGGLGSGLFSRSARGNDFLTFDGAEFGFFGTGVRRHNIPSAYTDLRNEYEARGFSATTGKFTEEARNDIFRGNNSSEAYAQAQKINAAMESFDQALVVRTKRAPISQLYNFAFGNKYKLFGKTLGVFVGVNYYRRSESSFGGENNRYSVREVSSSSPNIVSPNTLSLLKSFTFKEDYSIDRVSYGGLATLTYRLSPKNEFSLIYNANYGVDITTDRLSGSINETIRPLISGSGDFAPRTRSSNTNYLLRSTERPFNTVQMRGEHKFNFFFSTPEPLRFSWNASTSYSQQNDPDFRDTYLLADTTARTVNGQGYPVQYSVTSNRYFRQLGERNQSYKADLLIPTSLFSKSITFKLGGFYLQRNRTYTEIGSPRNESAASNPDLTTKRGDLTAWNGPEEIGVRENANVSLGGALVPGFLFNPARSANSYKAAQQITAFYGMVDFKYNAKWRFVGGARIENTDIQATADTTGVGIPEKINTKAAYDSAYVTNFLAYEWLPSATLIFAASPAMNFRLAYSNTLARPELNEITASFQFDPIQQANIIGNNLNLKNALYTNADFRWEWFPKPSEVISVSAFYKQVQDGIERIFVPNPSGFDIYGRQINTIRFRNNPSTGYVYGIELEYRKNLDKLPGFLQHFFMGVNGMIAHSETRIPDDELYVRRLLDRDAGNKRPLFDQPNYIINFNIGFERDDWGSSYNIFFNRTGERLIELSTNGSPNIYDIPAADLDFTFNQRIWKKLYMKGFVKNILNQSTRYLYKNPGSTGYGVSNETYVRRLFNKGTDILIGFTYTF
jgi:TonB-dependent receptor